MSRRTTTTRARLMRCPAASFWIKSALASCEKRDPVDSAKDAELLLNVLLDELDELNPPAQVEPQAATEDKCPLCGEVKPAGMSCLCFDNHCE